MALQFSKDLVSGLVLVVISLLLYFYLIPGQVADSQSGAMSPRFFPNLGSILIGIGGAILTVSSSLKVLKKEKLKESTESQKLIRPISLIASMAVFIFIFEFVGYLFAAPVLIGLLMLVFGARKPLSILITSVIVTATIYVVFTYGLNLPLE